MPTRNKFAKHCNNPACPSGNSARGGKRVDVGNGYIQRVNGKWLTWCEKCYPEPIVPQRCELTADGKLYTPFDVKNVTLIKSLPQPRSWNKPGGFWEVSLAPEHRTRLLEVCASIGAKVPDELKATVKTELAEAAEGLGLYAYQVDGVQWLSQRSQSLLCDEMGLGKSVQSLMAAPKNEAILAVVRPGLKLNWANEIRKWRPELEIVILEGKNNFQVPTQNQVVILGNSCLPPFLEQKVDGRGRDRKYVSQVPADIAAQLKNIILIGDEVHDYKNYKAIRSKRYSHLSRLVNRAFHLTGTPLLNRPGDLFGVLCSCNLIAETFGNFNRFQAQWGGYQDRYAWQWARTAPAIISETLKRVMLRRLRANVLPDLPPKQYQTLVVNNMPDDLARDLNEAYDEWLDVEELMYGERPARPKYLPPFELFSEIRHRLAESRVDAMMEFVEECEEEDVPLVVFSAHRVVEILKNRAGWGVIVGGMKAEAKQAVVDAFQRGELRGVAGTIGAMGVGLNLTYASIALFVDLDWTPENNRQAEDRLCRIGQLANSVLIVRMVSNHILDQHVLNLLAEKMEQHFSAIDATLEGNKLNGADGETDDQYKARMASLEAHSAKVEAELSEAEKAKQKASAKKRTGEILNRQRERANRPELPLTPERTQGVKDALAYMLSRCDGAVAKDYQGFNKPDACIAHFIGYTELETEDEVRTVERILSRYYGQLHEPYPILFEENKQ